MRFFVPLLLAAWCIPVPAHAQDRTPPEIKKIHVGFQTHDKEGQSAYKVGLWTPVYVELFGGSDGVDAQAGGEPAYIQIETVDSEDVGTRIRVPVKLPPLASKTFLGYVKTGRLGRSSSEVRVTLHVNGREHARRAVEDFFTLDIDAHLYLTLGSKMSDLHTGVRNIDKQPGAKEVDADEGRTGFRHVVFENKAERLPEVWFGYNGVDMAILATAQRPFLTDLKNDPKRLAALAQWVRRGGRLVVPIAAAQQDALADLLHSPVWNPKIPVVPPRAAGEFTLKNLQPVAHWGAVLEHPFQHIDPKSQRPTAIPVARLDDGKTPPGLWDVWVDSGEDTGSRPLVARVRYGLGQIVYLPFSFEDAAFFEWAGREKFLQTMVHKLAPKTRDKAADARGFGDNRHGDTDLATELVGKLDNFDVTVVPFGNVALFIILYILVVGPLDYFLLKYTFKRMEWTWITFPIVVISISVLAYFGAYALKGRDLRVNKIDIVDFDMRNPLKDDRIHAYGHSFFTVLSPRIQNYTIGLEPNSEFWGEKSDKVRSVDLLGWMGRPSGGPHEMGRSGSTGFFRKPYTFREDAAGLEGVPIPVWTTKAFSASWEQSLKAPFIVDLKYHRRQVRGKDVKITGKLENHLAVDLIDVWLIHDDRFYPISEGLKSVKNGAKPEEISVAVSSNEDVKRWIDPGRVRDEAIDVDFVPSDPTTLMKSILFHERVDTQRVVRNHLLRPLDLGWRIQEERRDVQSHRGIREAMLFARVRHVDGQAEAVTADTQSPLPTKLWLGKTPQPGETRPELIGQMKQDTYIRVILPVRPADE